MRGGISRRGFLRVSAGGAIGALAAGSIPESWAAGRSGGPIAISSGNGLRATNRAVELIREGRDPLVAAVSGVNIVEADPEDQTVGYGGLPNEDGIVELDASVMHGPTHRAGAVASIRDIKHPSSVALKVLERSDHVLLVGEGARRFAIAHGFPPENLLTEASRKIWLAWKEKLSTSDDWVSPEESPFRPLLEKGGGTIHCSALDVNGDLGGVTSTSGLAFKIPGRVGDSPIIGAGLFLDNEVGSCGATGRGEAVILVAGSASVVELMRRGATPGEACLEVLRRIATKTKDRRLLRDDGSPDFSVTFYALRKDGAYAGASLRKGGKFAVTDEQGGRLEDCAYLFGGE